MKKYIIALIIVLTLTLAVSCTIQLPSPAAQLSSTTEQPQEQAQNQPAANQSNQSNPTPEPTQEFVNNTDGATAIPQATPDPNMAKHDDMSGLWQLAMWEDVNINDMVFYDITVGMMNVMPYGDYASYGDYNYTYQNGMADFGNGAYDVILDQGVLVLVSKGTGKMIVFQPVTEQEMKSLAGSNSSAGDIVNGSLPEVPLAIVPTGPSGKQGYPHYMDDAVSVLYEADEIYNALQGKTWHLYGYQWDDGSIVHDFAVYAEFVFNADYSFAFTRAFGADTGLYEISGNSLELFYSNGTAQYHRELLVEINHTTSYVYLYIEDSSAGYEGCYFIYEGY